MRAVESCGKFQAGSNTIEMITLAGRVPGHGESLEAERQARQEHIGSLFVLVIQVFHQESY